MSVRQIVTYADGRLPTRSRTPDTVVARDLSMDIKKKGEQSIFIRTAPGRYTMRAIHEELQAQRAQAAADSDASTPSGASETEASREQTADAMTRAAEPAAAATTPMVSSVMRSERAGALAARSSVDVESDYASHNLTR